MSIQKESSNKEVVESAQEALTLIDIGQSFVLANASAEGVLRDLNKLLPELETLKVCIETLARRMLQDGRIQSGSLWKSAAEEVRVIGLANLDSERQDDYPALVFYTPSNRKEASGQVLAERLADWESKYSMVSLADPERTPENVKAILDGMIDDIAQAPRFADDGLNLRAIAHGLRRSVNALRAMVPDLLERCLPDGDLDWGLETGSAWSHRNGNIYTVIGSADKGQRVIYHGKNGKVWSRLLSDWHRSMTPIPLEGAAKLCASTRLK